MQYINHSVKLAALLLLAASSINAMDKCPSDSYQGEEIRKPSNVQNSSEMSSLEDQLQKSTLQNKNCELTIQYLEEEVNKRDNELSKKETTLSNQTLLYNQALDKRDGLDKKVQTLEEELSALKIDSEGSSNYIAQLHEELKSKDEQLEEFKEGIKNSNSFIESLKERVEIQEYNIKRGEGYSNKLQQDLDAANKTIAELMKKNAIAQKFVKDFTQNN